MPLSESDPNPRVPYQHPMPPDAQSDIVVPNAIPDDDRIWVPQAEGSFCGRCASTYPKAIG